MALILPFEGKTPQIDPTAYIAPNATLIGDVIVGPYANIWFGAVLRADWNAIRIGARTSVQDNCVLHVNSDRATLLAEDVIVGHGAVLEGCTIAAKTLIGMGSIVLNASRLGEGTILGAGALVKEGAEFPPGVLLAGVPAVHKRALTEADIARIVEGVEHYQTVMARYANQPSGDDAPPESWHNH
ncbi:MAG: gamma carbonic anhydrase family protein [Anaerolineales bacterium]